MSQTQNFNIFGTSLHLGSLTFDCWQPREVRRDVISAAAVLASPVMRKPWKSWRRGYGAVLTILYFLSRRLKSEQFLPEAAAAALLEKKGRK